MEGMALPLAHGTRKAGKKGQDETRMTCLVLSPPRRRHPSHERATLPLSHFLR
jgi:hypothetical protein